MDNTIALLSNISKRLETISQYLMDSKTPKAQADAVQKDIINNRATTTGLKTASASPQATVKPIQPSVVNNVIKVESEKAVKQEKSPIDKNISIKDITNFLGSLPDTVKTVIKLHGTDLKRFETVLSKISSSIVSFVDKIDKAKISTTSTKKIKTLVDSLSTLGTSIKKVALMAPLVPIFNLSLMLLTPGIKLLSGIFNSLNNIKNAKGALAGVNALNKLMKGMAVVVAASIAMTLAIKVLGFGEVLKGIGLVLGIVTALSVLAIVIAGVAAHIKLADIGLIEITKFIASMLAITAATMILGVFVGTGMPLLIAGLGGVLAVMTAYSVVAIAVAFVGTLIGGIEKIGILNSIVAFVAWNLALTAATMVLGVFINQGWEYLAYGFAGVAAVMAGYGLITIGMTALAAKIELTEKIGAMHQITKFAATCLGIAFGTVLLGVFLKNHVPETAAAFVLMAGVIWGIERLAVQISNITKTKRILNASVALFELGKFVAICEAISLGVIALGVFLDGNEWATTKAFVLMNAIVWSTFGLASAIDKVIGGRGKSLENASKGMIKLGAFMALCGAVAAEIVLVGKGIDAVGSGKVWEAFGLFTAIVIEGAALAALANKFKSQISKGAAAFAPIALLMIGASAALLGIINVLKIKKENDISWGEVLAGLGMMALIVVEFGALALAASSVMGAVVMALPALGMMGLLAAGSLLILTGVVTLTNYAINNIGDNWGIECLKTLGLMGLVVAEFGVLAVAVGAAIPLVLLGIPALVTVGLFANASIKLLDKVVDLQIKLDENNLTAESIKLTVGTIKTAVEEFVDLVRSVSFGNKGILSMGNVLAKGAVLSILMDNVAHMATALGSIALITTPDGRIRPAAFVDGKIVAGDAVDIVKSGETIVSAIKKFTDLISKDFKEISTKDMVHAMIAMKAVNIMLDPVSNFANALMSFNSSDGETLHTIKITDDGQVIIGPDVHLVRVANIIAKAIGNFAGTLFSKDNAEIWENMMQGGSLFKKSNARKAMGILATVIEPVCSFVDTLTKFTEGSSDGSSLTIVEFDEQGKEKYRKSINVIQVSSTIANAVTAFARELASHSETWKELVRGKNKAEKGMGIFSVVIDPVSNFVDLLTKFSISSSGQMKVLDSAGVEHETNILVLAKRIADAVTNFAETISNIDTSKWNNAEVISNVLKSTVNPVNDFVVLLSKYSNSPEGVLPILSESGEVIGNVDIIGTSNNIMNCTRAFKESMLEIQEGFANADNINIGASIISKSVKTLYSSIENKRGQDNLKKFGEILKRDTTNLKDFDNVLSRGSKKRIESINDLATAVENLSKKVEGEAVKKLASLFTALSNVSSNNVSQVIEELNKLNIGGSGGSGGGGTSQNTIVKAILEALGQTDINFDLSGINIKENTIGSEKSTIIEGNLDGTIIVP